MTTTFVTGGTGFIGRVFVRRARATGRRVQVLGRSPAAIQAIEALGGEPIEGDLLSAGAWQQRLAEADEVVHLAQPLTFGGRVTSARANRYREQRGQMDRHLLDPLAGSAARILYVGGTSFYGHQGEAQVDETAPPNPRGWGPYIADAIVDLDRRIAAGAPLIVGFPGYVYGPGSWFAEYFFRPMMAGKRLTAMSGRSRMGSFIHVDDCAAALLHLLERGAIGERYFVVDDAPRTWSQFAEAFAGSAPVPVAIRRVPRWLVRVLLGPISSASFDSDCRLSNAKLKASGYVFSFPTIDEGMPQVIATLRRSARQ
ncbi:NAD-dependent epimerase/dehydratase family protein [Nannocystaceae bacterium ST9]